MYYFLTLILSTLLLQSCTTSRPKIFNLQTVNYQLSKRDIKVVFPDKKTTSMPASIEFCLNDGERTIIYLYPWEEAAAKELFASDFQNNTTDKFELNVDLNVSNYALSLQAERMKAGYQFLQTKFANESIKVAETIKENESNLNNLKEDYHKKLLIQHKEYLEKISKSTEDASDELEFIVQNKYL